MYFGKHDQRVGGIAGRNNGGTIVNCYNRSTVTGSDNVMNVGGIVGANLGKVYNVYSISTVKSGQSSTYIGGICGNLNAANAILKYGYAYPTSKVTSNNENASTDIGKSPNYVGHLIGGILAGSHSNSSTVNNMPNHTTLNSNSNTLGYGDSVWKADSNTINGGVPIFTWQNE